MDRDLLGLSSSLAFVDEVYARYLDDAGAVDPSWAALLDAHAPAPGANGESAGSVSGSTLVAPALAAPALPVSAPSSGVGGGNGSPTASKSGSHRIAPSAIAAVAQTGDRRRPSPVTMAPLAATPSVWPLVNAFRTRGHLAANLDPLGLVEVVRLTELDPATWGFQVPELDRELPATGVHGLPRATLRHAVETLRHAYCESIGLEFMHIQSPGKKTWLAERMETRTQNPPSPEIRRRMLEKVIGAETFERFCHVKYPGTKRFSLEGSEGLIPMMDLVLEHGARLGVIESVIGMAHRGRLSALEQILQRQARDIFAEFEDIEPEASLGGGDVKYHLGFSCDRPGPGGDMHVSLAFNPSHLEAVDPIVLGRVRAKQVRHGDWEHRRVMGLLVHGDAAFAGQGLVAECLNFMNLAGYRTGGTVHLIVNNQVGFTASPAEQRSTPYCTDVAQMIQCPIWHVNGEDLDAVAQVIEMALEYRAAFGSDVVVDMYCYRKYGHNEMDEPSFTQPLMYDRIQHKESLVDIYGRRLIGDGVIGPDAIAELTAVRQRALETELEATRSKKQRPRPVAFTSLWTGYKGGRAKGVPDVNTGVERERLAAIAASIATVPQGFSPHPKIVRLLEQRAQMGRGDRPLDWGMGELLAYGSLLTQGHNVRLSGQDCSRGTFSHRHALITDIKTGAEHLLLGQLHPDQGLCRIYDSPLSEAGILGFELGFSFDSPDALVMWEAQFGDFVNGAQVIIDQFIVSSEDKWNRLSGLVLLLPHGYEGQGPEHSSARLERFLQSCAEDNIQVAQPTTPAQMFHLLRRQVLRTLRKPLIVMTPKSLLRLPAATSTLDELTTGTFQRVLPDRDVVPSKVTRALFCSGKIYYELIEERRKRGDDVTAIIRLEQLYPWWADLIQAAAAFPALADVAWVQDEPGNMGAGTFVQPRLAETLGRPVRVVARDDSASPATGSHKAHGLEQERIFAAAFGARV